MKATRQQAEENGWPRYFTGRECPRGHIAERVTRTGECGVCLGAYRFGFSPLRHDMGRVSFFLKVPPSICEPLIAEAHAIAHRKFRSSQTTIRFDPLDNSLVFFTSSDDALAIYALACRLVDAT